MTHQEFENYLALVSRLLRLNGRQTQAIGCELRDHLESRVAELIEAGVPPDQATRSALEEFGDAASLAHRFQLVHIQAQRRWMMRFATLAVAGLFLFSVLVMSMWPDQARFGSPATAGAQDESASPPDAQDTSNPSPTTMLSSSGPSVTTRENQRIEKALTESCNFVLDETPFVDVMDDIRETYGINVLLDSSAADDSLTVDEPISFSIREIPLRNALMLMLKSKNATYQIEGGTLKIISLDVANNREYMRRKIFDCRKLIQKMDQEAFGSDFNDRPDPPSERLQQMIQSTVAPTNWADASLEFVNGLAIVVASESMLNQIEDLLIDFENDLTVIPVPGEAIPAPSVSGDPNVEPGNIETTYK